MVCKQNELRLKTHLIRATTSCPLKLRDHWQKSTEMDLVMAVTSSVLMCKACTVHVWSIWRSGRLPWKSFQHLCGLPDWNDVEASIKYLGEKGVPIDDVKCFYQVANLKKFTESCNSDEELIGQQAHQMWTKYFGQKHCMLLKTTENCTVRPCTSLS